MLIWLERIAIVAAVGLVLEVGFFCFVGRGSDLSKKEMKGIGGQISVTSSADRDAGLAAKREWEEHFRKRRSSAGGARKSSGKGTGPKGAGTASKGKTGKPGEPEEEGDEEKAPLDEDEEYVESALTWLQDANAQSEFYEIPISYRDAVIPDLRSGIELLQQATGTQVDLPDGSTAYQITSIQPDSVIAQGGFQPGDVLISVNGRPVSSPQDGVRLYNEFRNETRFVVEIERNGNRMTLFYNLQ